MQSHNREDKPKTKNQHHNRVNSQTGALIRVKLKHCARGATSTSSTSRARSGISQRLLVVCSRTTTQSSSRTTRRSGRGGTVHGRCGSSGAGAGARGLGLGTGLSTGGQGGRGTRRGLKIVELVRICVED